MSEGNHLLHLEDENQKLKRRILELEDFIENAAVPLHWVDQNGIIIWANRAEMDMLGYTDGEYIGQPAQKFHADQEVFSQLLSKLINFETINDFRSTMICKDGSYKYVSIRSSVFHENGKFVHTRCFTTDITSQFREEERRADLLHQWKESEARLRLLVAAAKLGTWDWNFDTGKMHFSEELQHLLGSDSIEDDFASIIKSIHPQDRPIVSAYIKGLLIKKHEGFFDFSCRFIKQDGTVMWIQIQGTAYYNDDKEIQRILGCVLDITGIKASEERDAKLVAIVNSSYDAIISKTLTGIVTSWNPAAEAVFGYKADEMIGKSILQIIPQDRRNEEDYILEQLRSGKTVNHFETKRLTKDGRLLDISLTISPIKNADGMIMGISKIARDITEKRTAERRKNDFVSLVSHELKTPLTSILLCTEVLRRFFRDMDPSTGSVMVQKIETQAKRMSAMIKDFLSLSRVEEGKMQMRPENFNLRDLLDEITEETAYISDLHDLSVDCDASLEIYADRDKIGQVLNNLTTNAIKYSPAGGKVSISAQQSSEGKIRISVEDEGIGISEPDQKNLFDRFFRAENEEMGKISGFGIGLYIVAEVLRYHNSIIRVDSSKGKGSTFYFDLPQSENPFSLGY